MNLAEQEPNVEKKDGVTYVYDSSRTKRWRIHSFVMEWEEREHQSLELQGQVNGETWSLLTGVHLVKNTDTGDELAAIVSVDVINGPTWNVGAVLTPSRHISYSTNKNEKKHFGWGGGYGGRREGVEADLKNYKALALTANDLPQQIDVHESALDILETFMEGKFEPPPFVSKQTRSNKLASVLKNLLQP